MNDYVSVRLLLGVLSCSLLGIGPVEAQPPQPIEQPPSTTKEYEPPANLPSPPIPIFLPPSTPWFLGSLDIEPETASRISLLAPIVAVYAEAGLSQEEGALTERLQQLVSPDTPADDWLWANLFDAYVERENYAQAIAAFNQIESPEARLLEFVTSFPFTCLSNDCPSPQIINLLPTLETLVEQHLQADAGDKRQALIPLMRLYQAANLQTESRAIAQQLYTMEMEQPTWAEERLMEAALIGGEDMQRSVLTSIDITARSMQQSLLTSAEIAAIAGETERRDRLLQPLLAVATSSQFRQLSTASVIPDPSERENVLQDQSRLLIRVAQQLIAANRPQQALPLLDQAAEWLQQRPGSPFHANFQSETLILAYTAARQPTSVLQLLQALRSDVDEGRNEIEVETEILPFSYAATSGPNRFRESQVQLQVIEQAASTGQEDLAMQVARQYAGESTSSHLENTLRQLAANGQFDIAVTLVEAQGGFDQERAIALLAAIAIQATRPDIADTLVDLPFSASLQPDIPDGIELELAAQLRDETDLVQRATRWMNIAEELHRQEQTPQAEEILQRVSQQLEAWQQSARYQTATRPMRAWFILSERYAQIGQHSQAIALLNRLWQQEQRLLAKQELTNQSPISFTPPLPFFSAFSTFYLPRSFEDTIPSLALQAQRRVRPRLPGFILPRLAPPSPQPQSFQPQPEAIAQVPSSRSKSDPTAEPAVLNEYRRATYSRYYLIAGDAFRAWELFNSIPEENASLKSQLAGDMLTVTMKAGQPDAARQLFAIVYPSAPNGEGLPSSQAERQIDTLVRIANLYIERMDSENARQVLQQVEAIAWTAVPNE